ncbi:TRAP transporter substrate-binding protein [Pseudovibrio sp. Tun.PSC04-5.I4]|uniref:TRAP transporter substrate-binding protein n=1 Tax=Pseudovibrio sp. Tun.PSC04-5.I4 TaxID=1798213 RepID=UPI00088CF95A|nr:TRAP transporter substrate-binding protein [Pseudovibrio sp. Tun.PSC04-5.I4]SDR48873.1 C4-dicarboxylate-binding protein DctP [Pseudovibrio sp. Tun.PSC04-5.I4]
MLLSTKAIKTSVIALSFMAASSIASAADYSMTLATTTADGTPWSTTVQTFQKYVDELSEGRVNIDLSIGGALGNDVQLLQKTQLGSQVQSAGSSAANTGAVVPAARVMDIPFIIKDAKQGMDIFYPNGRLSGEVTDTFQKNLHKKNLHLLAVVPFEFRGLMTSEKSIRTPSDLEGLKIRVTPSVVERNIITKLGGGPTTLGISEVYTALQTGTVDGLAIPPATAVAFALHEVGKKLNVLNLQPHGTLYFVNYKTWKGFPQDVRDVIQEAADKAVMETIPEFEANLDVAYKALEAQNVEVYFPTDAEREEFRTVIQDSSAAIAIKDFNDDEMEFYNAVKAATAKLK